MSQTFFNTVKKRILRKCIKLLAPPHFSSFVLNLTFLFSHISYAALLSFQSNAEILTPREKKGNS